MTTMRQLAVEVLDAVVRRPESGRGLNVDETCSLLANRAESLVSPGEFRSLMLEIESEYVEQFLHTCLVIPDFADRVRAGIESRLPLSDGREPSN